MASIQEFLEELNSLGGEDRYFVYQRGVFPDITNMSEAHLRLTLRNLLLTDNEYSVAELIAYLATQACQHYPLDRVVELGMGLLTSTHGYHWELGEDSDSDDINSEQND